MLHYCNDVPWGPHCLVLHFFNNKTINPKLKYGLQPQSSIRFQLNNSQSIKCWSFVKIWPLTLQYQVSENPLFFEDDGHAATFKGENCCFSVTQKSLTLLSMKSLREMSQTNYHLSTQSEDVPVKVLLWWAEVCDIGCWKQTTTSQIIPYVNTHPDSSLTILLVLYLIPLYLQKT